MEQALEFVQKTLGTRLTHSFQDRKLTYTLKDLSGEIQFSANYEQILVAQPYSAMVRDKPLYRAAQTCALLSLLVPIGLGFLRLDALAMLAGCVCLAIVAGIRLASYRGAFSTRCTMLKLNPAPPGAGALGIRIMQRGDHDAILAELQKRWRQRLRELHAQVDPANAPAAETAKFKWLRDNDVISEAEYRAFASRIGAAEIERRPEPSPALN